MIFKLICLKTIETHKIIFLSYILLLTFSLNLSKLFSISWKSLKFKIFNKCTILKSLDRKADLDLRIKA